MDLDKNKGMQTILVRLLFAGCAQMALGHLFRPPGVQTELVFILACSCNQITKHRKTELKY